MLRVKRCLKKAIVDNDGNPISFHAFAIDPFSLTFTIENLFHLASLAKDGYIEIERLSGYYVYLKITYYIRLILINFLVHFPTNILNVFILYDFVFIQMMKIMSFRQ